MISFNFKILVFLLVALRLWNSATAENEEDPSGKR